MSFPEKNHKFRNVSDPVMFSVPFFPSITGPSPPPGYLETRKPKPMSAPVIRKFAVFGAGHTDHAYYNPLKR